MQAERAAERFTLNSWPNREWYGGKSIGHAPNKDSSFLGVFRGMGISGDLLPVSGISGIEDLRRDSIQTVDPASVARWRSLLPFTAGTLDARG
jgi:hypothetical protein